MNMLILTLNSPISFILKCNVFFCIKIKIGAVMGLFGGKLSEIFCRQCESRKTKAGLIGHEGVC